MDIEKIIEQAKQNIRQAIEDYREHTYQTDVLDDISHDFVDRLAIDSTYAKQDLRELFSKSPVWDKHLDALIINGTRTHNPDYTRISSLATEILRPALDNGSIEKETMYQIILFFSAPNEDQTKNIKVINKVAPNAYAPNKKASRIFKGICDALEVSDNTAGSDFQRLFAQFADELTARKINFKLYVSINPVHFLTMSNPKGDDRGSTLTSCHSLNSTEYSYNCGCSGYARDSYTFIVFTAADPNDTKTLNNRKTSRQIFAYKPGNGLLMQSRMYNTHGGTYGAQEESKLYRDLVQREISELEGAVNLWNTYSYNNGKEHCVQIGFGFGGYPDWIYSNFDGKVSIRTDHKEDCKPLTVGTYGLCICCGEEIRTNLYCDECNNNFYTCEECGERCYETYEVHTDEGEDIYVCEECRDRYYTYCNRCESYHPNDYVHYVHDEYICEECLDEYYTVCDDCHEHCPNDEVFTAYNREGEEIQICTVCLKEGYTVCRECGEAFDTRTIEYGLCSECRVALEEEMEVPA